jgi:hypothetical protein
MNFEYHETGLFEHYLKLAKSPATKAYAWLRVNELAKEWPEYYGELPAKLTAAMQKEAAVQVGQEISRGIERALGRDG